MCKLTKSLFVLLKSLSSGFKVTTKCYSNTILHVRMYFLFKDCTINCDLEH